ncbi:hypothetical protein EF294_14770 [Gordonia oryzae]|uniref:Uncharacterized protein n=1 Tax=Gordonia oryzae TaxID=2487349 RepID=A0A3N4GIR9_9ACTN|nr:hypothetical protein [Gordonia oryzae]RPA59071.1 hypothetical protein EF294_14770 [Gordonia oryzae]
MSVAGWAIDDDVSVDHVVSAVVKQTELMLCTTDVTWGPCVGTRATDYGHRVDFLTAGPHVRIEVDVVPAARYACATFAIDGAPLERRVAALLPDVEGDADGVRIATGRSHVLHRHMMGALAALIDDLDREWVLIHYDGPLTEDDGTFVEQCAAWTEKCYYVARACNQIA